jgi:hypothetical protein
MISQTIAANTPGSGRLFKAPSLPPDIISAICEVAHKEDLPALARYDPFQTECGGSLVLCRQSMNVLKDFPSRHGMLEGQRANDTHLAMKLIESRRHGSHRLERGMLAY